MPDNTQKGQNSAPAWAISLHLYTGETQTQEPEEICKAPTLIHLSMWRLERAHPGKGVIPDHVAVETERRHSGEPQMVVSG